MTVVFGLGIRLCVCKHTNLENGILCNMPPSVVNDFFDHSEFEAINILNSHRAPCCNKHQFRAKMTVDTRTISEISLLNIVQRITKMAL